MRVYIPAYEIGRWVYMVWLLVGTMSQVHNEKDATLGILMQFSIVTLMLLEEQMNNENTATMVTVKMLKEACRARGLKISRKTKEELVEMLHADIAKEQEAKKQKFCDTYGFKDALTLEEAKAQGITVRGWHSNGFIGIVEVDNYVLDAHSQKYGVSKVLPYTAPTGTTYDLTEQVINHRFYNRNGIEYNYESYISVPIIRNGELVPCNANNNTDNTTVEDATHVQFRQIEIKAQKFRKTFNRELNAGSLLYHCDELGNHAGDRVKMDGNKWTKLNHYLFCQTVLFEVGYQNANNGTQYLESVALIDRRYN